MLRGRVAGGMLASRPIRGYGVVDAHWPAHRRAVFVTLVTYHGCAGYVPTRARAPCPGVRVSPALPAASTEYACEVRQVSGHARWFGRALELGTRRRCL